MTIVNMTIKRIEKALTDAGISLEGLTISTNEVEVYCTTKGQYSRRKTESQLKKVGKALGWGGYRCATGAWVLQKDYQDMGDWNDRSSRWHY